MSRLLLLLLVPLLCLALYQLFYVTDAHVTEVSSSTEYYEIVYKDGTATATHVDLLSGTTKQVTVGEVNRISGKTYPPR